MNSFNTSYTSKRPGHRTGMKNIDKWKKDILTDWVLEHKDNPYPSEDAKEELSQVCQLTKKQVSNWFTNARKRHSNMMNKTKLLRRKKRGGMKQAYPSSSFSQCQMGSFDNAQNEVSDWAKSMQDLIKSFEKY
mmetsp:Transcript_10173/g.11608  ORF Transcript_10173/g.11608 Transcript_10173/m.11608 type:complete len:133 (+) Transcript_10173:23-421(+)